MSLLTISEPAPLTSVVQMFIVPSQMRLVCFHLTRAHPNKRSTPSTPQPLTRVTQQSKARLISATCSCKYGASKKARQSRKCVLQCWCAGKVNKQTLNVLVRATDSVRRKTGITLEERARDEHGIEAISGIFSSPAKSPPKRGSTVTGSESMDIQESMWNLLTKPAHVRRPACCVCADMPTFRLHTSNYHVCCNPTQ